MKIFLVLFTIFINAPINVYGFFIPKEETEIKKIQPDKIRPQAVITNPITKTQDLKKQQAKLEQNPEYTQIYDEYIDDINKIAKTGQFVETNQIQKDFTGMHTNDSFLVK